jgi:hypothetical protein
MKKHSAFLAALVVAASAAVCADAPSGSAANVPHTLAATRAADVVARAEHAFTAYVVACSSQDGRDLSVAMTDDATVEYASQTPGAYLTVDGSSLFAEADSAMAHRGGTRHISNVWIFPTNEPNTVFVQYEADRNPASLDGVRRQSQLVMLEMRGDRIARMRSFGPRE